MSIQTPSQRLRCQVHGTLSSGKDITLPAGAFVRCVSKKWMPKYHPFGDYNEDLYVAAFTQFGMALIPNCDLDRNIY